MEISSLSQEVTELHAGICSALADPKRILILYMLAENRHSVSDLAREIGITQSAASRHLKFLRERDLIRPERNGTSIEYHLTDHRLIEALDLLRSVLCDRITRRARIIRAVEL